MKPLWVIEAEKDIGVREIQGVTHEPKILSWWKNIGLGGIKDDEKPYCAAWLGAKLKDAGCEYLRSGWARDYLDYGVKLDKPVFGCIVVLYRKGGGGHTGFGMGYNREGKLLILGANQNNEVNISAFDVDRVLGYRYPKNQPIPMIALSISDDALPISTSEA